MTLDRDTLVIDNSDSCKEAIGRTYQSVDVYTCGATYLGALGYCLELVLRTGVQHSTRETEHNIVRILPMAAQLTSMPLLFRAGSVLFSEIIMRCISEQASNLRREIAFIIKWNPRNTAVEVIAAQRNADASTLWSEMREGKRECMWELIQLQGVGSCANTARCVLRLIERTIDKHEQPLLLPEYELKDWSTTLPMKFSMQAVIDIYKDHATHEQFHSEFKTDWDLERLPSSNLETNYLVCALAAVAMKILRLMGQNALLGKDGPMRHIAKRRWIKTMLQEIMFKTGRMIKHAERWALGSNLRVHTESIQPQPI